MRTRHACWAFALLFFVLAAAGCDDDTGTVYDTGVDQAKVYEDGPLPDKGICGPGTTQCGSKCFDLQKDANNCGSCGNACGSGEVCATGKCAFACPKGQNKCGGGDAGALFCTNLQTDNKNCGACDNACKGGEVCAAGVC